MPGPDGPPSPDYLGSEIEHRTAIAQVALDNMIWRPIMEQWDQELKPASIRRHRALFDAELGELDEDQAVQAHVGECVDHRHDMPTNTTASTLRRPRSTHSVPTPTQPRFWWETTERPKGCRSSARESQPWTGTCVSSMVCSARLADAPGPVPGHRRSARTVATEA